MVVREQSIYKQTFEETTRKWSLFEFITILRQDFGVFSHINIADLVPEHPENVLYPLHLKVVRGWGDRDGGYDKR